MAIFFKKRKQNLKSGFTLVELLVTITIFVILTSVVLFSQSSFDNTILLNNLAYDIALTIRQAQSYVVNSQEAALKPGTFPSYGAYFNDSPTLNKSFILYADTLGLKAFSGGTSCLPADPECIQKYSITRGSSISGMCVVKDPSNSSCIPVSSLSVYFQSPNPDATMYVGNDPTPYQYAEIKVSSASGAFKTIVITGVGQIYVK